MLILLNFNAMSVNFPEFLMGLLLILAVALFLIIITGIIHTKDNYVSIIEKKHKFYKVETRKFSYYFPILYRKAAYISLDKNKIENSKHETYFYQVIDPIKFYKVKNKIKEIIEENDAKEKLEQIGVKLIFISK